MRIERIELLQVRLPLVHEFETSSHRKSYLEHVLVRVEDADGAVGWGEVASPSGPFYTAETVETWNGRPSSRASASASRQEWTRWWSRWPGRSTPATRG